MSACKTMCGSSDCVEAPLCSKCIDAWRASVEAARYNFFIHNDDAARVALVDFCTRMRLESQNGAKP